MNRIGLLSIFLLFTLYVKSQDSDISKPIISEHSDKYFIGANVGFTTGIGFSYIYWPNKNGIQLTLLPLLNKGTSYLSLGCSYLRKIKSYQDLDFFLYWGNHLTNISTQYNLTYNTGFGPGFHYSWSGFCVNFMFGYGIFAIPNNIMTRPTAELGLYFNL
jgi:hypothetical protein